MEVKTEFKRGWSPTLEQLLYLLAFVIALVMRLAALGQHHLSELEAGYALQAFQVAQGDELQMLGHPAYIQLTGLLFYLFGSGEVLARLLPALAGSFVVLLPYIVREFVDPRAALVAAFGLALDPISVAVSRQAGSPAMALGFLGLAVFFWQRKRPLVAGFFAGLLLLSGISFVFGLVSVLAAWLVIRFATDFKLKLQIESEERNLILGGVGIALVSVGTLFALELQGLAALAQAVADYFAGWFSSAGAQQPLAVLFELIVYQPLGLLFAAFLWLNRARNSEAVNILLTVLFLVIIGLILLYSARQAWMLIWAAVPLWLLAGQFVGEYLSLPEEPDGMLVWGGAVFYLVLLVYWWMNLAQLTTEIGLVRPDGVSLWELIRIDPVSRAYFVRLLVTILIPVLIAVMIALISWGWTEDAAIRGAVWGVGFFLFFYGLMAAWGFSAPPEELAAELWVQGPSVGYTEELMDAIEEASVQITGTKYELEMVYQIDSRLVDWLLRGFPNAVYSPQLAAGDLPDVILNQNLGFIEGDNGDLYGGQHFVLQLERAWSNQVVPPDFGRWLVYRQAPVEKDWAYLWTRADRFPLYELAPVE
ncbi:MAG: glycosyltransferase family 39 protein [Anaerolineales bacterium]|nr:glycosyltransferase family 39 protein [Anaerolineales bacterium]